MSSKLNHQSLTELQRALGYTFGDQRILIQALIHKSYGHEHHQDKPIALRDNERLEFLGDAILDVIISDILIELYPESNEGQLTKMRAAVVNEKTLAEVTKTIHLSRCVMLGKGENLTGGAEKPSILSGVFEALIAAIYVDGGFNAVFPVVRHLFVPFFEPELQSKIVIDFKTQLQEEIQARWKVTPTYFLKNTHGPDHAKVFEVEVRMKDTLLAQSAGSSKKEAEQNAARLALATLMAEDKGKVQP